MINCAMIHTEYTQVSEIVRNDIWGSVIRIGKDGTKIDNY